MSITPLLPEEEVRKSMQSAVKLPCPPPCVLACTMHEAEVHRIELGPFIHTYTNLKLEQEQTAKKEPKRLEQVQKQSKIDRAKEAACIIFQLE